MREGDEYLQDFFLFCNLPQDIVIFVSIAGNSATSGKSKGRTTD